MRFLLNILWLCVLGLGITIWISLWTNSAIEDSSTHSRMLVRIGLANSCFLLAIALILLSCFV